MLFSYENENFKFYEFKKFQVLVQVFDRDVHLVTIIVFVRFYLFAILFLSFRDFLSSHDFIFKISNCPVSRHFLYSDSSILPRPSAAIVRRLA